MKTYWVRTALVIVVTAIAIWLWMRVANSLYDDAGDALGATPVGVGSSYGDSTFAGDRVG